MTSAITIQGDYPMKNTTFITQMDSDVVTVIKDYRPTLQQIVNTPANGNFYRINLRDNSVIRRHGMKPELFGTPFPHYEETVYTNASETSTIHKSALQSTILSIFKDCITHLKQWKNAVWDDFEHDRKYDIYELDYANCMKESEAIQKGIERLEDKIVAAMV